MSNFITSSPAGAGKQDAGRVAAGIEYLRQGRLSQAYVILSQPGTEKDPAARFALGLCHFRAGELSAAISCFEQALGLLRAAPSSQGLASRAAAENTETYLKLAAQQIADKTHLGPMDADFCTLFPKAAEHTVLLALIDAYIQKGMIEHAQRLSSGLTGPAFEAYKKKLLENS